MSEHTPEPWRISPCDPYFVSRVGCRGYIAKMLNPVAPNAKPLEELRANARRIVACVNACVGLPTESLEALGDLTMAANAQLNKSRSALQEAQEGTAMLRSALAGLIGADTEAELRQMEAVMRTLPMPAADRAASINAIHALLATMPANQEGVTS